VAETAEREGKNNDRKIRGIGFFFSIFAPYFLYAYAIKSTLIYRGER